MTPLERLSAAIAGQLDYLRDYEKPSETLLYGVLRAIDDLYMRDLLLEQMDDQTEDLARHISSWGVNHALGRLMPSTLEARPFRDYAPRTTHHQQVDDFLLGCGVLHIAERLQRQVRAGLLSGEVRSHRNGDRDHELLVLKTSDPSYADEQVGLQGLKWAGELSRARLLGHERRLAAFYKKLAPEVAARVELVDGWRMSYLSSERLEEHFLEWAKLYVARMQSSDLIGAEEVIGGRPFSRYVDVLTALSGRAHRILAFAQALLQRHPGLSPRGLLTGHVGRDSFVIALAQWMDADRREIEEILASFILRPDTLARHASGSRTIWAPIVQASAGTLMLPLYGLDINPFTFLFDDLRVRYEADWFRLANKREGRWVGEMNVLFQDGRWLTHDRNLRLREGGRDRTDIDYAVADRRTGEVSLFQLKWLHAVGVSDRAFRNSASTLVDDSNSWVNAVLTWLDHHGIDELLRRLGFTGLQAPTIRLFVLGRYHAYIGGFDRRDTRAVWSDWAHFRRVRIEGPRHSLARTAAALENAARSARARKHEESLMLPIDEGFSIIVNPVREPA